MSTQHLSVELEAKIGNFSSNLDRALGKLEGFGKKAERVGQTLSISLSAPLAFLAKKMSDSYAQSDSMARGLATLEKNADTLQARLNKLNEIAKLPGLGFDEAVAGDIRLRTVLERIYGIEGAAKQSERILLGFGNAVALVGKGKAEFDRALYGVQQLANTKFPLGEDLNIIKDAIPQVSTLLNNAFGTDRSDELKKLGITSQQVMEVITKGLEKLPRASGGWKNALENMGNSVSKSMSNVFGSIDKVLGLTGMMDKFSGFIERMSERFQTLSPNAQRAIAVLGGLAVVIPPILAGLGTLTTVILPAIKAGFVAVTGPIGLAVAAIALAVAAIVMHWDKVKAALINSGVWDRLKALVKSALGVVASIFGVFSNLLKGDWGAMWDHFLNIFKYAWNGILNYLGMGLKGMHSLIAKGLKAIGAESLAEPFIKAGKEVDAYVEKLQFKVPDVSGQMANLFEGFNFGGDRKDNVATPGRGGAGDGKAKKKVKSYSEQLEDQLKEIDRQIKDFQAKHPTLEVPLALRAEKGRLQDLLKIDDKNDLPTAKDIGPVQSAAQRYWEAVSNGWLTPMEQAFNSRKNDVGRVLSDVQASITASINSITSRLAAGISWPDIEDRLTNMLAGTKNAVTKYQQLAGELMKLPEGQRATALKSWEEWTAGVSQIINQGLQSAFEGVGEAIGHVLTKSAGIQSIPQMLLGVVAGMAIQLGKLAIGIGIASEAIKTAFKSLGGVGAIAAGVALIALGTVAKAGAAKIGGSVPALAKGGLAFGPTMALVGDNPRASVDPEVVSPLSKLQDMMGGGGAQKVQVTGGFRIGDLWAELQQYEQTRYGTR